MPNSQEKTNKSSLSNSSTITLSLFVIILGAAISVTIYNQNLIREFDVRISLIEQSLKFHNIINPNINSNNQIDSLMELNDCYEELHIKNYASIKD